MIKRSKIASIILLIAINILLLSLCTKNAFAGLESESIAATLTKLMTLGQAIQAKWISDGGAADTPIYPGGAPLCLAKLAGNQELLAGHTRSQVATMQAVPHTEER